MVCFRDLAYTLPKLVIQDNVLTVDSITRTCIHEFTYTHWWRCDAHERKWRRFQTCTQYVTHLWRRVTFEIRFSRSLKHPFPCTSWVTFTLFLTSHNVLQFLEQTILKYLFYKYSFYALYPLAGMLRSFNFGFPNACELDIRDAYILSFSIFSENIFIRIKNTHTIHTYINTHTPNFYFQNLFVLFSRQVVFYTPIHSFRQNLSLSKLLLNERPIATRRQNDTVVHVQLGQSHAC